jgi:uncharacterized protein YdeI (BOF family)
MSFERLLRCVVLVTVSTAVMPLWAQEELTFGIAVTGNIEDTADRDLWAFDVSTAGTLTVNFDAPATSSLRYWLVSVQDTSGNILAAADTGDDAVFLTGLDQIGTYYLVVEQGSWNYHNIDQYSVTLTYSTGTDGVETEQNDAKSSADDLGSGVSGMISSASDQDWYQFDISTPKRITITFDVDRDSTLRYWLVTIQDASGNVLAAADTGGDRAFTTGFDQTGTYYLVVEQGSWNEHNTDQYSIDVVFTDGVDGIETEGNNAKSSADNLGLGISGMISSGSDEDWYQFNISSTSTIDVTFDVDRDSTLRYWLVTIQDASGNVLAAADTGGVRAFNTGLDQTGTYYLVIEQGSWNEHNTDQYSIDVVFTDGVGGIETEGNDSRANADDMEFEMNGTMRSHDDQDFFRFDVSGSTSVNLFFDAAADSSLHYWFVSIQDSEGNVLAGADIGEDWEFSTGLGLSQY